jgi:predicted O-linked N-acetylglucosamine transferase (SPINDLY family)
MAGSLLQAVGLPELIAYSAEQYEALALRMATEPGLLDAVRGKLAGAIATTALFDTDRFCKHIEVAYRQMWERHLRGEPPASIVVDAIAS